jgi:hypothetical protein
MEEKRSEEKLKRSRKRGKKLISYIFLTNYQLSGPYT